MRFWLLFICIMQFMVGACDEGSRLEALQLKIHLNEQCCVTELIFPDEVRVVYEYENQKLRKISRLNPLGEILYSQAYEWDGNQLLAQTGWITTRYVYDSENKVIAKINPWYQEAIEYDSEGQAVRVGDRIYSYDQFGQITSELGRFVVEYDENCNLVKLNGDRIATDEKNRIIGNRYDSWGNLLRDDFVYNKHNQLVSAAGESYFYDDYGRRIQKGNERYVYLGFDDIACFEYGICKMRKIPGPGGAVAIEIDGNPYIPVIDAQGIIRKLIDPDTNSIYREVDCDIFGNGLTDAVPYAYRGKRYDSETGLIYFGRRYYDPAQHRWLTPDPLGCVDHSNLYQYVYNNPLKYCDPFGGSFWGYALGLGEIALGGAVMVGGIGLEIATLGGFTFGVGITTGTGAALIGHGLAMTTCHAQDIKAPPITWKNDNPFNGPVDGKVFIGDTKGNVIPVPEGHQLGGSKDGRCIELKDGKNEPTGLRKDGKGHPKGPKHPNDPRSWEPHAHRPGILNADGTPWLPIY